jgi:hypothetical protein
MNSSYGNKTWADKTRTTPGQLSKPKTHSFDHGVVISNKLEDKSWMMFCPQCMFWSFHLPSYAKAATNQNLSTAATQTKNVFIAIHGDVKSPWVQTPIIIQGSYQSKSAT